MSFKRRGVPENAKYRQAPDVGTSHTCDWSGAQLHRTYLTALYLHVRYKFVTKCYTGASDLYQGE
jgi:hypothetical protein